MVNNRPSQLIARISAGCTILLLTFSFTSCKNRQTERSESSDYQVEQLYSVESIYQEVQQQLKENPNDADALYHLADLYDRNGQYREAIEAYKKVIQLKPDKGYAYFKMGTAYSRSGQPDKAVEAHLRALEHLPNNAQVYNNLGIAYGKLGKDDEEISALQKALQIRPRYASASFNLGATYLRKGDKESAQREYEKLRDIDTTAAEALLKLIEQTH